MSRGKKNQRYQLRIVKISMESRTQKQANIKKTAECKVQGCSKEVGQNGRKGMCQSCYRSSNSVPNISSNTTPEGTQSENDLAAQLFSAPPLSLNQLDIEPTAPFVNASFKTNDADYVAIPETAPQSMDTMFAMIIQMKEDYNHQLRKRDEAIATLSLCVSELQGQLRKQEEATQKVNNSEDMSDLSSQQPIEELKESVQLQNKTVYQQQVFLEHLANKDRINNLAVAGFPEGEDSTNISSLIQSFLPNEDIKENQDFQMKRLGNNETARKPRPLLLQFQPAATNKRKKM